MNYLNLLTLALTSLVGAKSTISTTMTSPITGITYKLISRGPFNTANQACAREGGHLADISTTFGEVAWIGTWVPDTTRAWIGSLDGIVYKCAAVYAGGAVAIPKARSGRGPCHNLELTLCQLDEK